MTTDLAVEVELTHLMFRRADAHERTDLRVTILGPGRFHLVRLAHPASAGQIDTRRRTEEPSKHTGRRQ